MDTHGLRKWWNVKKVEKFSCKFVFHILIIIGRLIREHRKDYVNNERSAFFPCSSFLERAFVCEGLLIKKSLKG